MITWICSAVSDPDDQEFLIELYEEFHALMFSVARRYNHNWMSCEDIVQESILRIMDKLDVLRSKNAVCRRDILLWSCEMSPSIP